MERSWPLFSPLTTITAWFEMRATLGGWMTKSAIFLKKYELFQKLIFIPDKCSLTWALNMSTIRFWEKNIKQRNYSIYLICHIIVALKCLTCTCRSLSCMKVSTNARGEPSSPSCFSKDQLPQLSLVKSLVVRPNCTYSIHQHRLS